jgi:hypothetical protein
MSILPSSADTVSNEAVPGPSAIFFAPYKGRLARRPCAYRLGGRQERRAAGLPGRGTADAG